MAKTNIELVEKKISLAALIKTEAERKFAEAYKAGMRHMVDGKRVAWKEEDWKREKTHHDICVALTELAEKNNFPYGVLVYIAIGTDAHKKPIFERGYTSMNEKKAETIIKWLKAFAKYNDNPKFYTNDKVVHAFAKFYDTHSTKTKDFNIAMKAWEKMPLESNKTLAFKNMADFYNLFYKPFVSCAEVG